MSEEEGRKGDTSPVVKEGVTPNAEKIHALAEEVKHEEESGLWNGRAVANREDMSGWEWMSRDEAMEAHLKAADREKLRRSTLRDAVEASQRIKTPQREG